MRHLFNSLLLALLAVAAMPVAQADRIKDLTSVATIRSNQLLGYGLVVGLQGMNSGIPVLGIGVRQPKDRQEANVFRLAEETAEYCGVKGGIPRESVEANCDYIGGGYGIPTDGMAEAVQMMARQEGILLDPVYSGKAMAGMIDLIRKGVIGKQETVVFLHTGGAVGLFGYTGYLEGAMGG